MQEIRLEPYAPVLMESTRAIGYSLDSAIADLLDNNTGFIGKPINTCTFAKEIGDFIK